MLTKSDNLFFDEISKKLIYSENSAISEWKEYMKNYQYNGNSEIKIDILMCVYNSGKHLRNALESVLNQTYSNFNLIIVTDPCTDNSIEILREFEGKYNNIKLKINQERSGFIGSLNQGVEICQSKYIMRMDTDDLIHPQRIEKQLLYMLEHPEIDVLSSYMKSFNESGELDSIKYRKNNDEHKVCSLFYSPLSHAASMFKSNVLKKLKYREGYLFAEDYDLWTRVLDEYKTDVFEEELYLYRLHEEQTNIDSNRQKLNLTLNKIASNLLNNLFENIDEKTIQFHVENCMNMSSLEEINFIKFDQHINKILKENEKSMKLNSKIFNSFVFKNYWLKLLELNSKKTSWIKLLKLLISSVNQLGLLAFLKLNFKLKYLKNA